MSTKLKYLFALAIFCLTLAAIYWKSLTFPYSGTWVSDELPSPHFSKLTYTISFQGRKCSYSRDTVDKKGKREHRDWPSSYTMQRGKAVLVTSPSAHESGNPHTLTMRFLVTALENGETLTIEPMDASTVNVDTKQHRYTDYSGRYLLRVHRLKR